MDPRLRKQLFMIYHIQPCGCWPEANVITRGVLIGDHHARQIQDRRGHPQNAQLGMPRLTLVEHSIPSVEVEVRMVVKAPGARYQLLLTPLLNLFHSDRRVRQPLRAISESRPIWSPRRSSASGGSPGSATPATSTFATRKIRSATTSLHAPRRSWSL